ncbi:MAG: hypothetical protein NTY12_00730 [Candidatus Falkowbacteria bacterium]|nr:hypothetical protein [Candidatus Falkowbacteria bacterium]
MENDQLNKALITVAARFDLFNYPLTDFEIWQFLPIKTSYETVKNNLSVANLSSADGLFFLRDRQEIINVRQTRYREADKKIKIIQHRLKFISWLPGIKLICLANVIGPNNIKPETDIDLFIITKSNRVWLVKLLATIILKILALRPTEKSVKNKLCLSFLVDETALDLSNCRQGNDDWYFTYWLAGLMPLFGSKETYLALIKANGWLNNELPNWQSSAAVPLKRFKEKASNNKSSAFGNFLEKLSHKIHLILMNSALRQTNNQTNGVIINDHILKLHTTDRREYFFAAANEKINKLLI